MTSTTAPPAIITDRTELSALAYGFMASKALFAALELDVFTHLAGHPGTADDVAAATGVPAHRMRTLLRALAAVGLLVDDDGRYANGPAAARHLVRGTRHDLGDYYRLQVGRQIYPAMAHLDAGLAGTGGAFDTLAGLFADSDEARTFTEAQHVGSHAVGRRIDGTLDLGLGPGSTLLDVGGGSGALSIALCAAHPGLHATVLDYPTVLDVARGYRDAAGLADRIALQPGDAAHTHWPDGQDVVLMSYLLSALGDAEIDVVLEKAAASLRPGGSLVVHDFMLADAGPGPAPAALWFLQYLAYRADAVSFTVGELNERLAGHGFTTAASGVLIPGITSTVHARKAQP